VVNATVFQKIISWWSIRHSGSDWSTVDNKFSWRSFNRKLINWKKAKFSFIKNLFSCVIDQSFLLIIIKKIFLSNCKFDRWCLLARWYLLSSEQT
jgi:hypothetical protein